MTTTDRDRAFLDRLAAFFSASVFERPGRGDCECGYCADERTYARGRAREVLAIVQNEVAERVVHAALHGEEKVDLGFLFPEPSGRRHFIEPKTGENGCGNG